MEQGQFVAKIGWRLPGKPVEYLYLTGEMDGVRLVGSQRWHGVRFHSVEEAQRQADATVAQIVGDWDWYAGQTGREMPGVAVAMWDYAEFPRSA